MPDVEPDPHGRPSEEAAEAVKSLHDAWPGLRQRMQDVAGAAGAAGAQGGAQAGGGAAHRWPRGKKGRAEKHTHNVAGEELETGQRDDEEDAQKSFRYFADYYHEPKDYLGACAWESALCSRCGSAASTLLQRCCNAAPRRDARGAPVSGLRACCAHACASGAGLHAPVRMLIARDSQRAAASARDAHSDAPMHVAPMHGAQKRSVLLRARETESVQGAERAAGSACGAQTTGGSGASCMRC